MNKHLMTVLEATLQDKDGHILWHQENMPNVLHSQGEFFMLSALFNNGTVSIPANYYAGLDNRTTPAAADTLTSLSQEPTQNGYARQALSSSSGFVVATIGGGDYQATSNVMTFSASGGSWGPIKNVFVATTVDSTGYLISTAALDGSHTLNDGELLTVRIALSLSDLGGQEED